MAHVQKKIYMAISDEEYLKKMQEIVYTEEAKDIFSLIYNYKIELETENKTDKLEKVKELEEYLRNNEEGLQRYQYKLGYKAEQIKEHKEDLPSLGSEESHMYCVCRDRMKKNRTSWSQERSRSNVKGNNEQDEWNNRRSYYKERRRKNKRGISAKDTRAKEGKENKNSFNTLCRKI